MQTQHRDKRPHVYLLRFLLLVLIAVTVYAIQSFERAGRTYDDVSTFLSAETIVAKQVAVGTETVAIPNYRMFLPGNVWAIISRDRPLAGEAGHTLVDIPVRHGDEDKPMKVAREITDELERLVNAAEAANEPLMVSSAYRSLAEQGALYDEFVRENGTALAEQYVLPVGASEHHTGLSVDFSSVSSDCAADSDTCSLSQSAAGWLAENAPRHGFILRYPDGKRSITGVGYEPWHYRYVGVPLARAMATTDLTLEETVQLLAPGYAQAR